MAYGDYTPIEWTTGDTITETSMNNQAEQYKYARTADICSNGTLAMQQNNITGLDQFYVEYYEYYLTASDTLKASNDDEASGTGVPYQLAKTITIPAGYHYPYEISYNGTSWEPSGNIIRIKVDLKTDTRGQNAQAMIYRNGVPVSSEALFNTTSDSYSTFSVDISGWQGGDAVELYCRGTSTYYFFVRNFRIYGTDNTRLMRIGKPADWA